MSPGRWEIGKRSFPDSTERKRLRATLRMVITSAAGSEALLERECFAMAGGANGCRLVQDAHLREKILGLLAEFCQVKGNKEKLLEVAVGQPFRLGLMRAILEIAGDADCEFLREAEDGLPLGVKHPQWHLKGKWSGHWITTPWWPPLWRRQTTRRLQSMRPTSEAISRRK